MFWLFVFFCVFVFFSPDSSYFHLFLDILKPKMAHQKVLWAKIRISFRSRSDLVLDAAHALDFLLSYLVLGVRLVL